MNRNERRKHAAKHQGWEPWEQGTLPTEFSEEQITGAMKLGSISREDAVAVLASITRDMVVLNNLYQVNIRRVPGAEGWPEMLHLSIKRRDKQPLGPEHFRHMQRIKNELVGPECEAVELYPAESRLVDTANQYHLWVLVQPGVRFPFGWTERLVVDSQDIPGAVQQPLGGSSSL